MHNEIIVSEESLRSYKIKKITGNVLIYAFLIAFALFIIIPFYWMIATALRTEGELNAMRISFFPENWQFRNFKDAIDFIAKYEINPSTGELEMKGVNFYLFYFNTIIVGALTTLGTLFTTILAAFAFARLNFKGKEALFSLLLATMMIPGEIFVISNYSTISSWGLKNTYAALVLPFITSVFYIFFLRQTFRQVPNELYLAAKVDGTNDFKYLLKVMIPLAKATIISILILSMMGTWNAYVWPNLVANDPSMHLVSNGLLEAYKDDQGISKLNYQMAAAAMVTIPLLIVFLILRKQIMRGVSRGGLKG